MDRDGDISAVLAHRHHKGGDFWATPAGRIYVGNPSSTIGALLMLYELGLTADHEAVRGGIELIRAAVREDGRIRVAPRAPMSPCLHRRGGTRPVPFRPRPGGRPDHPVSAR